MKKLIYTSIPMLLLLSMPSPSFAYEGGHEGVGVPGPSSSMRIYEVLDVEAIDITGDRLGAQTLQKSVGGLECQKSTPVVPHPRPSFYCTLAIEARDDRAIFEALKVKAEETSAPGANTYTKQIGALTCIKTEVVVPDATPSYECKL